MFVLQPRGVAAKHGGLWTPRPRFENKGVAQSLSTLPSQEIPGGATILETVRIRFIAILSQFLLSAKPLARSLAFNKRSKKLFKKSNPKAH